MSTYQGLRALTRRGVPLFNDTNSPPLPKFDDIDDLVTHMQKMTDALSCLLLNERKWKKGLSTEHLQLLESSVDQFRNVCENSQALLQLFFNCSRHFTTLFESIRNLESYKSIEPLADELCYKTPRKVSTQISTVEGGLQRFTRSYEQLLCIAPKIYLSRYSTNLHEILPRLETLWKIVATYLASVLEHRAELPHPDVLHSAEIMWSSYGDYVIKAMNVPMECSDALKAAARAEATKRNHLLSALRARILSKINGWFGLQARLPR